MKRMWALALCVGMLLVAGARAEVFCPANAREGKLLALECLMDCAFSAEYGDPNSLLLRWEEPLYVYVEGCPTAEDERQLDDFLMELSFRVPLLPMVERVAERGRANITMAFVPEGEMARYVANYVDGNWGFVTYYYSDSVIGMAEIAIASDTTTQAERNSILREELVNCLGLGNDHYRYEDSIIYECSNEAQTLSPVDWLMLNMVYSPYTAPGMTASEVYEALYGRIMN